jgi:VanZ family protein
MLTPRTLQRCFKVFFAFAFVGLAVLMLGPFQGLEQIFGLSDKEAHAIAFFAVTNALFIVAPRTRRNDLAMIAATIGLALELLQGLTGRSMSLGDFIADTVGITAAVVPGVVERLRHQLRTHPNLSLNQLAAMDRRTKGRRRRTADPSGVAPAIKSA